MWCDFAESSPEDVVLLWIKHTSPKHNISGLYTNTYATYAVYMGAYAWGLICPVEIPLCPSFYIQKTKL